MRNFSTEIHISFFERACVTLLSGSYCEVKSKGMAQLFLVNEGSAFFSIPGSDPVKVNAGGLYSTNSDVDLLISAEATIDGLVDQQQLRAEDGDAISEGVAKTAAVLFQSAIPSIANPLPGVLPLSTALSSEDVKSAPGLKELLLLFQNDSLLRASIREFAYKQIAEIIGTTLNEFSLEKLESNITAQDEAFSSVRITRVLNAMHQHPEYSWTLVSLAEKAFLSRSAFAKEFKNLTGSAPLHYLGRLRMDRAAWELGHGKKPISQIAYEAGYQSDASFNKAFCKIVGETPGRYRRARGSEGA